MSKHLCTLRFFCLCEPVTFLRSGRPLGLNQRDIDNCMKFRQRRAVDSPVAGGHGLNNRRRRFDWRGGPSRPMGLGRACR